MPSIPTAALGRSPVLGCSLVRSIVRRRAITLPACARPDQLLPKQFKARSRTTVAARLPKRRLFKSVLACPSRSEIPESLRRYSGARCGSFIFIFLRTLLPSLCHPAPRRLAIRVAGRFGHFLAFRCVSQKFLRWVHVPSTLDILPVYQTPNSGNVPRPLQNESGGAA
jgi:hypothetical protein